jgi:uncharacterized cupredoxin-like copper-binding protein
MSGRHGWRAGVLVALVAGSLAACTDDGSDEAAPTTTTTAVTTESFAAEVVDRCLERSAVIDETEPDSDPFVDDATDEVRSSNAEWVRTFAAEFDALADDIDDLEAPEGSEEQVDELTGALRTFAAQMEDLAGNVEEGTVTEADTGQAFRQLAAVDEAAARLDVPGGLSTCGQEPEDVDDDAQVVDVTAVEHAFEVDTEGISSGPTAFVLSNEGEEIHELVLLRSLQPDGVVRALGAEGEGADPAEFAEEVGETSAGPGLTGVLNVDDLQPGEYGIVCFVPGPDGIPHVNRGMVEVFTVE